MAKNTPSKAASSKAASKPPAAPSSPSKAVVAATPLVTTCAFCGKPITRTGTVTVGHGARCAAVQAHFATATTLTPQQYKAKYTLASVPPGYVKTAVLHKLIVRAQHSNKASGANVCRMVRAFGTDKGIGVLASPIWRFFYVGRARYINAWCSTPAAYTALGSNNHAANPAAPTLAQVQAAAAGNQPAYHVYAVPTL